MNLETIVRISDRLPPVPFSLSAHLDALGPPRSRQDPPGPFGTPLDPPPPGTPQDPQLEDFQPVSGSF